MRLRTAAFLAGTLLFSACSAPNDAEGWAKHAVSRNRLDEKLAALEHVRRSKDGDRSKAVPYLVEVLKQAPRARAEAALALGEIGDPAAVQPLLDALDQGATDRETRDANRHVASALGALRAKEAVPILLQLTTSPDGFTQVAAVDALGQIGDGAAVERLVAIATAEQGEPFTAKKALVALGRIGDPRAVPAVLRMLFYERPGVSFFPEAAFATSQIGAPMAAPLLAVLEGRDAELAAWARSHGVVPGALYAKAAQLLGDVGDPRAVPALVQKLAYQDAMVDVEYFVRVYAAESLGRMRAREAVRPLVDLAAREKDLVARSRFCDAIARIGDPAAVPLLQTAAGAGPFEARAPLLTTISQLGTEADRAFVEGAKARDCGACPAGQRRAYDAMLARLDAAKRCGADVGCWANRLADAESGVRDRAALEVGRAGGGAQAGALADAVVRRVDDDADVGARDHAVLALDWVAQRAELGASGPELAAKLEAMIAQEKGRTLTARVNEDALRVAARLRRAAK
jgi:HEAT repeat protein